MSIVNNNMRTGVYVSLKYVAPRKRLEKPWGVAGDTLQECFNKISEWRKSNGGRFTRGTISSCSLYDVDMKDGRIITMQSVAIFAPQTPLNEEQMEFVNEGC